jgi:hypothetical protein
MNKKTIIFMVILISGILILSYYSSMENYSSDDEEIIKPRFQYGGYYAFIEYEGKWAAIVKNDENSHLFDRNGSDLIYLGKDNSLYLSAEIQKQDNSSDLLNVVFKKDGKIVKNISDNHPWGAIKFEKDWFDFLYI